MQQNSTATIGQSPSQTYFTLKMLWVALAASHFIYLYVTGVMTQFSMTDKEGVDDVFFYALAGVSILMFILAHFVPTLIFNASKKRAQSASEPFCIENKTPLFIPCLLRFIFIEAAVIYGLIWSVLFHNILYSIYLFVPSLLYMIWSFPTPRNLHKMFGALEFYQPEHTQNGGQL